MGPRLSPPRPGAALIANARDTLRLKRLDAGHFLDNPASGRVLAKLGFRPTGRSSARYSAGRGAEAACREFVLELADERGRDLSGAVRDGGLEIVPFQEDAAAPRPPLATRSSGFLSGQSSTERQPQPMQPSSRSRSRVRRAMRRSRSARQSAASRAQPLCPLGMRGEPRPDLGERDADRLRDLDDRHPAQHRALVAALVAAAAPALDQPLALPEMERRDGDAAAPGDLARRSAPWAAHPVRFIA